MKATSAHEAVLVALGEANHSPYHADDVNPDYVAETVLEHLCWGDLCRLARLAADRLDELVADHPIDSGSYDQGTINLARDLRAAVS